MKKAQILLASVAVAAFTGTVSAQSIEESYAKLCSGDNKGSESCQVLRKALQEKLAAEDDAAPAAPAKKGSAAKTPAAPKVSAAAWGFWAALPDSGAFHSPGAIRIYSWKEKNRVMEVRNEVDGGTALIRIGDHGGLEWVNGNNVSRMIDAGDGTFRQEDKNGQWRVVHKLSDGAVRTIIETPKDGGWAQSSETVWRRLSDAELADARAVLKTAGDPANIRANWGVYGEMAGKTWVYKLYETRYIWSYEWDKPGLTLISRFAAMTKDKVSSQPTARAVTEIFDPVTKSLIGANKVQPDGTLLMDMGSMRKITRSLGAGSFEEETQENKKGKWKRFQTSRYTVAGGADINATLASLTAPKEKGSGGGLLGAVAGAVGGAAAGAAFGGGAEAILGGAAKGAAMFSGDAGASAALNVAGDSLIGGNAAGAIGSAASGGSAGGSYPTRPNALNGSSACSMMNEGNYRTVALEGGNDVQLKTMCGQAFEYYVMYKRAIAQGYSEADANRTYAAHEGAAQNAISFYTNNRAD